MGVFPAAAAGSKAPPVVEFITVKDCARRLGLSERRTLELVNAGVIPHLRHGRSIRVSRVALERLHEEALARAKEKALTTGLTIDQLLGKK